MSLQKFREQLQELMTSPDQRPFVCDGTPLDCPVFIVGINATTKLDFWHFWDDQYGFHKEQWFEAYQTERIEQGKSRITPTRNKIKILIEELAPHRCLETNLYATTTARARQLEKEDQSTRIFEFLLETIQPKVIYLYGSEPFTYFSRQTKELKQNELKVAELTYGKVILYATHHMSYRASYSQVRDLAHYILKPVADELVQNISN